MDAVVIYNMVRYRIYSDVGESDQVQADRLMIELFRQYILHRNILVMPKNQFRVVEPLQPLNRVQTAISRVMIPCKRSMRMFRFIVLLGIELIRSQYKSPIVFQGSEDHTGPDYVPAGGGSRCPGKCQGTSR